MRVLVLGGAGFVGSNIAIGLAREGTAEPIAFDNLHRRGSELNLPRLRAAGVEFRHGDIREPTDLAALPPADAIVECSAEPSVMAGTRGGTAFPVHTNLLGAYNSLELARAHDAQFIFISTSRVYPVAALRSLSLNESATRFELLGQQSIEGASAAGISERFPLSGPRTLYGATKLAAELVVEEYADLFSLRTTVNRCGVLAGPWQMGNVDQGVFTHWVFHHHFGLPLRYIGFGGSGKQVRDLLHIEDLVDLLKTQIDAPDQWAGVNANVGGGPERSVSLLEATTICREMTGREVPIGSEEATRQGDVPLYVSDCALLYTRTEWRPQRSLRRIFGDVVEWIEEHEGLVAEALQVGAAAAAFSRP